MINNKALPTPAAQFGVRHHVDNSPFHEEHHTTTSSVPQLASSLTKSPPTVCSIPFDSECGNYVNCANDEPQAKQVGALPNFIESKSKLFEGASSHCADQVIEAHPSTLIGLGQILPRPGVDLDLGPILRKYRWVNNIRWYMRS